MNPFDKKSNLQWAISEFQKPSLLKRGQVQNLSCENEFYLNDNKESFSQERFCTWPHFKTEACGISEMAYWCVRSSKRPCISTAIVIDFKQIFGHPHSSLLIDAEIFNNNCLGLLNFNIWLTLSACPLIFTNNFIEIFTLSPINPAVVKYTDCFIIDSPAKELYWRRYNHFHNHWLIN